MVKDTCPVCGCKMIPVHTKRCTKWRNYEFFELEDRTLYYCELCKLHNWSQPVEAVV